MKRITVSEKFILITLLIVLWISSFGGSIFEYNDPKLNLGENPVYRVCDAGEILDAMNKDRTSAYAANNSEYVCTNVRIDSIESRKLTVTSGGYSGIVIRTDASVPSSYRTGTTCSVFGKLELGRNTVSMTIKNAILSAGEINPEADYYTLVGGNPRAFYDSKTELRTMKGGTISYRVPENWKRVRCTDEGRQEIFNSGLMADADCYFLNELTGKDTPECFIVFYFDIDKYVSYDNKKDQYSEIEAEIVKNICPDDNAGPLRSMYLYFDKYAANRDGNTVNYVSVYGPCRVEFIFNETEGGIAVMMYVTESAYNYREEALYIQRSLSIR